MLATRLRSSLLDHWSFRQLFNFELKFKQNVKSVKQAMSQYLVLSELGVGGFLATYHFQSSIFLLNYLCCNFLCFFIQSKRCKKPKHCGSCISIDLLPYFLPSNIKRDEIRDKN